MSEILHPVVHKSSSFTVYMEDNSIGWILHCYVHQWSNSVYKEMMDTMAVLIEIAPRQELYAFSYNKKLTKFCGLFGMEVIDTIETDKGKGELLCLTL